MLALVTSGCARLSSRIFSGALSCRLTAVNSTCGTKLKKRSCNTFSKPFITLRPAIKTIQPKAMPIVDEAEINEIKPERSRRWRNRRANCQLKFHGCIINVDPRLMRLVVIDHDAG